LAEASSSYFRKNIVVVLIVFAIGQIISRGHDRTAASGRPADGCRSSCAALVVLAILSQRRPRARGAAQG
jgi:hypothetical protein